MILGSTLRSSSKIEVSYGRIFARPSILWQREELGVNSKSCV